MIYDPKIWLKNYDPGVEAEVQIKGQSLIQVLEEIFQQYSDKPALNYMGLKMNYRDLMTWTDKFARGLTEKGLGSGDVVAMNVPNIPHYIIGMLGAFKAGCVVSGLSPMLTPDEMAYQLTDSGAKVMISLDMIYDNVFMKIADRVDSLKLVLVAGAADFLSEAPATPSAAPEGK